MICQRQPLERVNRVAQDWHRGQYLVTENLEYRQTCLFQPQPIEQHDTLLDQDSKAQTFCHSIQKTHHDNDLLSASFFNVLGNGVYRPLLECLGRRAVIDGARLFLTHPESTLSALGRPSMPFSSSTTYICGTVKTEFQLNLAMSVPDDTWHVMFQFSTCDRYCRADRTVILIGKLAFLLLRKKNGMSI